MSLARFEDLAVPGSSAGSMDEMVFPEPWNARAFGLVLALSERGLFTLKEFQGELISAVGEHEKTGCIDGDGTYYTRWVEALTALLLRKGLLSEPGVRSMEEALVTAAARIREHQHEVSRQADGRLRVEPVAVA